MASRLFQRGGVLTLEKDIVILFGNAVIGAAGAVGTIKGSGILDVVHGVTGVYTIQLEDKYARYLGGSVGFVSAAGSGIASVEVSDLNCQALIAAGSPIPINCFDFAGVLADPAASSVLSFMFILRNSSIKGKGE